MNRRDVVIVGCGPTGMMLAAELRLAGIDPLVVERRETQDLAGSRGGGFHARTIEVLDQRGVADRFLAEGTRIERAMLGATSLDLGVLPSRHPYTLALFQNHVERILAGWLEELGVAIRRGVDVEGVSQDDDGADVRLASGETLRAGYVVGADGGRSVVRRSVGIELAGPDATRSSLIAEVQATEELPTAGKVDDRGVHGLHRMDDGSVRVVVTEAEIGPSTPPTTDELRRALTEAFGTDLGIHDPTWLSRFTDATRQATAYRDRRVLLAGDAAHVHSPTGGQGIGLGIQDAVNLGWKLARVVRGVAGDGLLDSYHAERHPAGARALGYTMAQSLFQRADPRQEAMRDILDDLLGVREAHARAAALVAGLDVVYDLGDGHPLLGRRMPDIDLDAVDGPVRVAELLREARPLLLELGGPALGGAVPPAEADGLRHVAAKCDGHWELPVLGEVAAPSAVLVRPDGHVAWVGEGSDVGLAEALRAWRA
ncbi:FAD-dependent monooxygenase [Georgenia sp. Z1344]|uniref:FAD-dependent monooxygenase n=1 Tax=Georgenia sp. Z1344 TaxID=3416706 RepID=UPI003CF5E0C5